MYFDGMKWAIEKGVSSEVINSIINADKLYSLHTLIGFVSIAFIAAITIIVVVFLLTKK